MPRLGKNSAKGDSRSRSSRGSRQETPSVLLCCSPPQIHGKTTSDWHHLSDKVLQWSSHAYRLAHYAWHSRSQESGRYLATIWTSSTRRVGFSLTSSGEQASLVAERSCVRDDAVEHGHRGNGYGQGISEARFDPVAAWPPKIRLSPGPWFHPHRASGGDCHCAAEPQSSQGGRQESQVHGQPAPDADWLARVCHRSR